MKDRPEMSDRQVRIADLRKRLAQLGYPQKNIRTPAEKSATDEEESPAYNKASESVAVNDSGSCAVFTSSHEAPSTHQLTPEMLAMLAGDSSFVSVPLDNILFIDTETTGLGAAGVLAFLTGIGRFDTPETFTITQYFLRTPSDEGAMLREIREMITEQTALITFNGRSFDIPLLDGRGLLNRLPLSLGTLPHLDLMWIARKIWYRRLGSYSLGTLEQRVLNIRRSGADIPGYLIPIVYTDYLRTGSLKELSRVFYHNEIDVLSMAVLLVRVAEVMISPPGSMPLADCLSLCRMMLADSREEEAEKHLLYISSMSDPYLALEAQEMLATLYKRQGRKAEAVPIWHEMAEKAFDLSGHEELAKYHEWTTGNLSEALDWTDRALGICSAWPANERRNSSIAEWTHRRGRLLAKLGIRD